MDEGPYKRVGLGLVYLHGGWHMDITSLQIQTGANDCTMCQITENGEKGTWTWMDHKF